jgi:RNA polymerase sigma factor (sigma-70 family)
MSPRISIRLLGAQSDERLTGLAEEGHERAFEALVQRYRRPLQRYCRRMRLSEARSEDVLQQAFLQAWMAFARGAEVHDVRPWLYRIVHNAAVNTMRGNAERHDELTEAAQDRAALTEESNLQRAMAVHDALAGVAALPQMQQQAIFLTAVDGQTHDEVASVLGVSEGAVRGLLHRARTTLRSAAAALTPPPLLAWAAGGGGAAAPTAERIAELSAGGGAAGLSGLLLKGAVVAVTAGAVATGATVASSDSQPARPAAHRSHAARPAGATVAADRTARFEDASALPGSTERRHLRGRSEAGRRHDHGRRTGSGRGNDRSGSGEDRLAPTTAEDGAQSGHGGAGDSSASRDGLDDSHGGTSGGSGSSGGQAVSGGSGSGGHGSGSGSSSGSSGHGGGDDGQVAVAPPPGDLQAAAAPPDGQPSSTSGSGGGDDAAATASGGGGGTKGGSGSDG